MEGLFVSVDVSTVVFAGSIIVYFYQFDLALATILDGERI